MTQMTKIQKLGQIVRTTRKQQGLTQEQLAAVSGVGVRFVRELEQGKESCHIGKSLHILTMLGLDIQIGSGNLK
jgi:y4mF family transcriptional regulator